MCVSASKPVCMPFLRGYTCAPIPCCISLYLDRGISTCATRCVIIPLFLPCLHKYVYRYPHQCLYIRLPVCMTVLLCANIQISMFAGVFCFVLFFWGGATRGSETPAGAGTGRRSRPRRRRCGPSPRGGAPTRRGEVRRAHARTMRCPRSAGSCEWRVERRPIHVLRICLYTYMCMYAEKPRRCTILQQSEIARWSRMQSCKA